MGPVPFVKYVPLTGFLKIFYASLGKMFGIRFFRSRHFRSKCFLFVLNVMYFVLEVLSLHMAPHRYMIDRVFSNLVVVVESVGK